MSRSFDDLVAEGELEPTEGWDFSWFDGRATEDRPSWAYARSLGARVSTATAVLDVETGGGEVFAEVLVLAGPPQVVAATESWPPNLTLARRNLSPFGAQVAEVGDEDAFPFPDASFDLVASRHPTTVHWAEIARVLRPGGNYFSQQIGSGTNRELTEFMMGPQPTSDRRSPERLRAGAEAVGLEVMDLRDETVELRFFDVGAVVYFLRKVLWTVPGFSVAGYRERLRAIHEKIEGEGPYVSHARRLLLEARKPLSTWSMASGP